MTPVETSQGVLFLGALTWILAGAAVFLGRNLTRSLLAGYAFMGCLCLALSGAGAGFLAVVVSIMGAMGLAGIQVFGWMLVDVDRDHLAPTDAPTWIARCLAFALLGAGIALLIILIGPELGAERDSKPVDLALLGQALFGALGGVSLLLGLSIAAALLATMLLLRDDEEAD